MKAQKQKKKQLNRQEKAKLRELFTAIEMGDEVTFNASFSSEYANSKLSFTDHDGVAYEATLLFWALKNKQTKIVLQLLLAKADPNMPFAIQGRQGVPLLWAIPLSAIDNKCDFLVLFLVNNNADTHYVLSADESLIRSYFNFLCRNVDKIKKPFSEFVMLQDRLSDMVNIPLAEGITPLKKLVENKARVKVINLFLQKGAISKDIDFSKYGETSEVEMAFKENCLHLVELLIAKGLLKKIDANNFINCEIRYDRIEIWDQLMRFCHRMPLTYCILKKYITIAELDIRKKWLEILETLFKCKKEAINESFENSSLLIQAVINDEITLVDFLLEQGADPNFRGVNNQTALIVACYKKQTEIVELLLKKHADPNLKNTQGFSSLRFSIIKNNLETSEILLKNGADPNEEIPYEYGVVIRLLDFAIIENNPAQIKLLLEHGVDIEYCSDSLINYLLSTHILKGLDCEIFSTGWASPLGVAFSFFLWECCEKPAGNPSLKITKLLLKAYTEREILVNDVLDLFIVSANYIEHNELEALLTSFQKDQNSLRQKRSSKTLATSIINFSQVEQSCTQFVDNLSLETASQLPQPVQPVAEGSAPAAVQELATSKESANTNNSSIAATSSFSPANRQQDKQSAFAYLTKLGFTSEHISNLRKRNAEGNEKNATKIAKYSKQTFWDKYHVPESLSWQGVKFNKRHLQEMFLGENRFFYLDVRAIEEQGCDKEMSQSFQKVRRRIDGTHIKTLERNDYYLDVSINGESPRRVGITHELRIFNSEARVLLFPLASDEDKKYQLYIACKFMLQGLHTLKDEKSLKQSNKGKKHSQHKHVLKVTVTSPKDEGVIPGCSMKTLPGQR